MSLRGVLRRSNLLFIFILSLLVLFVPPVFAISLSISDLPGSIDQSQDVEVNVILQCSGCGDSYMRGVFFPNGSNYFGFTQNNTGSWISTTDDKTQYFKIAKEDLVEGSWSGKIKIKPNPDDSAYTGSGNYLVKIGRYTSASDSSADWSNDLSLNIIGPTSTMTPTPTSVPTHTPTPVPTSTSVPSAINTPTPSKTPTPIKTNTSTPTLKKNITPTITLKLTAKQTPTETEIAEITIVAAEENSDASESAGEVLSDTNVAKQKNWKPLLLTLLFIGSGCILISVALIIKKQVK